MRVYTVGLGLLLLVSLVGCKSLTKAEQREQAFTTAQHQLREGIWPSKESDKRLGLKYRTVMDDPAAGFDYLRAKLESSKAEDVLSAAFALTAVKNNSRQSAYFIRDDNVGERYTNAWVGEHALAQQPRLAELGNGYDHVWDSVMTPILPGPAYEAANFESQLNTARLGFVVDRDNRAAAEATNWFMMTGQPGFDFLNDQLVNGEAEQSLTAAYVMVSVRIQMRAFEFRSTFENACMDEGLTDAVRGRLMDYENSGFGAEALALNRLLLR